MTKAAGPAVYLLALLPEPKTRKATRLWSLLQMLQSMSQKMKEGRVVHRDVLKEVYEDINKRFGSNEKVPD